MFFGPLPFTESVVERGNVVRCSSSCFSLYRWGQYSIAGAKTMFNQHTILLKKKKKSTPSYSSSLFIQLVLFQMQLWVRWFNRVHIYYHNFYKIKKKCTITNFLTPWTYFAPPLHIHRGFDLNHTWLAEWFKGLDLVNIVPEELWTEVCDIV